MVEKNRVLVIVGPTASGKSAVAVELAKRINGEIISADSMQIYKGLDVGTAKVTKEEAQGINHSMIDICNIDTIFSVAEYKEKCYENIEQILKNGKVPIVVGGTGLYINSVVNNMCFEEENNMSYDLYEDYSDVELIKLLKSIDPKALDQIDKNNRKRVIRAIVMAQNGKLKSDKIKQNDLWHPNPCKYIFFVTYIDIPRDILYDKIKRRIDDMDEGMLVREAKLVWKFKNSNIGALQAIGYKEIFPYIENKMTFSECKEILKQNTRHYAKRQITWFKKLNKDLIIDGTDTKEKQVEEIVNRYNG